MLRSDLNKIKEYWIIKIYLFIIYIFRSEDSILNSTSDVTEALRRTTQLMQQEIERSAYSAKVLGNYYNLLWQWIIIRLHYLLLY